MGLGPQTQSDASVGHHLSYTWEQVCQEYCLIGGCRKLVLDICFWVTVLIVRKFPLIKSAPSLTMDLPLRPSYSIVNKLFVALSTTLGIQWRTVSCTMHPARADFVPPTCTKIPGSVVASLPHIFIPIWADTSQQLHLKIVPILQAQFVLSSITSFQIFLPGNCLILLWPPADVSISNFMSLISSLSCSWCSVKQRLCLAHWLIIKYLTYNRFSMNTQFQKWRMYLL